jgi:hypothetical protein
MTTGSNKITSKRELAVILTSRSIDVNEISIRLQKTVDMWLRRKEVIMVDGNLILA